MRKEGIIGYIISQLSMTPNGLHGKSRERKNERKKISMSGAGKPTHQKKTKGGSTIIPGTKTRFSKIGKTAAG